MRRRCGSRAGASLRSPRSPRSPSPSPSPSRSPRSPPSPRTRPRTPVRAASRRPRRRPRPRARRADEEGARLIAFNMALNGTPREETERYLRDNFDLDGRRRAARRRVRPRRASEPRQASPRELGRPRERVAELIDLHGAMVVLVVGPEHLHAAGRRRDARRRSSRTLERIAHGRLVDPAIGRLLDALEPWAGGRGPRLRRRAPDPRRPPRPREGRPRARRARGRHGARSRARPGRLAARARGRRLRRCSATRSPRQIELRHRYAACFPDAAHPYDVLLDDYEPGLERAEVRPLFADLTAALRAARRRRRRPTAERNGGVFSGPFGLDAQRAALVAVLGEIGFDARTLAPRRLAAPVRAVSRPGRRPHHHPLQRARLRQSPSTAPCTSSATASTTRAWAISCAARRCTRRARSASTSRRAALWENMVGRSRPFRAWLLPRLREASARRARRRRRGRALPRGQLRATVADPHGGRRDDVQPPRRAALRPRAAPDRRDARRSTSCPRAWNEGMQRAARRRGPLGPRGRPAGRPLGAGRRSATSRPTRSAT